MPEELTRWGALFGDYEILQPFPQIAREVFTVTAEEATNTATRRFAGLSVEP